MTHVGFSLNSGNDPRLAYDRALIVVSPVSIASPPPILRLNSIEERNEYEKYDLEHKIRAKFVEALKQEFADWGLTYSIGGLPVKRIALRHTTLIKFVFLYSCSYASVAWLSATSVSLRNLLALPAASL